ncbi:LicD family protein [Butyrivibrio sp. VCB2001]|uniref:LicD family protein n=1 Tax=Butyrivibrio sp. VCB2001 TaxID=1280667 RepID=UPI000421DE37|nr:LicD family protein [Butyrivibrio sp. VCB2001]
MTMLHFPENYFKNEVRCNFHITAMMKRLWAAQMEILAWVDEVCNKYGIRYIICYGSLIGAVRHKGFIPWDDDIDIAMLRSDYRKFMEVVARELPPYLHTRSLLPGAYPPKEMTFNINNGRMLDTSPEFLERFHGCPYSTGVDVFIFDRVPENQQELAFQDRLIRMLDRMLMLQWKVDDGSINGEETREYSSIRRTIESELDYTFTGAEPMTTQILRLLDLACSICEDCGSKHVENREQVIYYGEKDFREDNFTDRIFVPFEGMMYVPIPKDYDGILRRVHGDYETLRPFLSQHKYPIYKYQRTELYRAYKKHGWDIPEEFLEYDENGNLVEDPEEVTV